MENDSTASSVAFYDERRSQTYGHEKEVQSAEQHGWYERLVAFIDQYELRDKKCLEIGSGSGVFQDMVADYTGTDIAQSLASNYHKPYAVCHSSGVCPLPDESFDGIWSIHVHEHIPDIQTALREVRRLLKPGGVIYFAPAWQCRPWAADGYSVRPYSDFGLKGKMIKASIPVRDHLLWRSLFIVPKRLVRHGAFLAGRVYTDLLYKKIKPNWEKYWVTDADACNSIDPHDAILWFLSNGFECLSHPPHIRALLVRTGGLVFRKL